MQNIKDVRKKGGGEGVLKEKVNSEPCRYIVHGSHRLKDKAK